MTAQTKIERDPKGQVVATVEIKKIGNSAGVILPKEVMARLNLRSATSSIATLTAERWHPGSRPTIRISRRRWKSLGAASKI